MKRISIFAAALALFITLPVQAQSVAATMSFGITVEGSCEMTLPPNLVHEQDPSSSQHYATIPFQILVKCSNGMSYTISSGAGQGGDFELYGYGGVRVPAWLRYYGDGSYNIPFGDAGWGEGLGFIGSGQWETLPFIVAINHDNISGWTGPPAPSRTYSRTAYIKIDF